MKKSASYFFCGDCAYRSEVSLYRHEGVTAEDCAVLKAPPGLSCIYVLEGRQGALTAWPDALAAFKAMLRSNGLGFVSVPVFEEGTDTGPTQLPLRRPRPC